MLLTVKGKPPCCQPRGHLLVANNDFLQFYLDMFCCNRPDSLCNLSCAASSLKHFILCFPPTVKKIDPLRSPQQLASYISFMQFRESCCCLLGSSSNSLIADQLSFLQAISGNKILTNYTSTCCFNQTKTVHCVSRCI